MTIRERLRRSNLIMLVVPVAIAGLLLAVGLGGAAWLLDTAYLPRFGLNLHMMGEELEQLLKDMRLFVALYAAVVVLAVLAAVGFTNFYLTRALFAHIQQPLDALVQGVRRVRDGDLDSPIGYTGSDEFRPACDAVDEMAARLKESLADGQREQQKKQELLAGMSHDLKSPLATIRAYTEALLEGVAADEAKRQRYLQTIYARETDLEALVNRLFELAKLDASEYPVHLRPLPLRETVLAILGGCEAENVTLDCAAVTDCTVTADRELLGRVLHNIVDNSRKYGADTLQFGTEARGETITLWAQDNGPGVPAEQLPNLFDPFYRGDAARTRPASGSGLGLAVVRQSLHRMGGEIYAENAPGGGLRLVMQLPLAKE
ncbi:sensor histidine kinase [Gemmiger sp.]